MERLLTDAQARRRVVIAFCAVAVVGAFGLAGYFEFFRVPPHGHGSDWEVLGTTAFEPGDDESAPILPTVPSDVNTIHELERDEYVLLVTIGASVCEQVRLDSISRAGGALTVEVSFYSSLRGRIGCEGSAKFETYAVAADRSLLCDATSVNIDEITSIPIAPCPT